MNCAWEVRTLRTRRPFVISRGGTSEFERVYLTLTSEGRTGRGEAAPSAYYGQDAATVISAFEAIAPALGDDPMQTAVEMERARRLAPGASSAIAALNMALLDLAAQICGVPLCRYLGYPAAPLPPTSFTIAIGDPEAMLAAAREARSRPVLKVKMGWPGDMQFLKRLRSETDQLIRVDANEGWSPAEARERVRELHESVGVELVEQPCPARDLDGLAWVTESSPVPIFGDECCVGLADLPRVAGAVHGVNIKLAKCGGPGEAAHMMRLARALGLRVMMGCMIESSLGITAAAHLGAGADALDLDGHLLLAEDPFAGVEEENGRFTLPDRPGIGAIPRLPPDGIR